MTRSRPASRPPQTMQADRIQHARQAGYLVLPAVLDHPRIDLLRQRVDGLLAGRGPDIDDGGGTVYQPGLEDDPGITGMLGQPLVTAALRGLLGGEPRLAAARYRSPKPGGGAQALHRDEPWPQPDGRWATATVIVGLVPFTAANGATRLVPGTHRDRTPFTARSARARHPHEITLTGPAGTAYIFTGACLHSGTRNTSTAPRPGIQATYRTR